MSGMTQTPAPILLGGCANSATANPPQSQLAAQQPIERQANTPASQQAGQSASQPTAGEDPAPAVTNALVLENGTWLLEKMVK